MSCRLLALGRRSLSRKLQNGRSDRLLVSQCRLKARGWTLAGSRQLVASSTRGLYNGPCGLIMPLTSTMVHTGSVSSTVCMKYRSSSANKVAIRTKKTKAPGQTSAGFNKNQPEEDDDDDDDDDSVTYRMDTGGTDADVGQEAGKEVTVNVPSLRLDTILKAGLVTSRSKMETAFYESRVRINGQRVLKKSVTVDVGDEVDLVIGFSEKSEHYLDVRRVQVTEVRIPKEVASGNRVGNISVKLRRYKALTIENYADKWSKHTSDPN